MIGFRAYGQRDPLNEYKSEAFVLFEAMLANLREAVTGQLMHVELAPPEEQPGMQPVELPEMHAHHIDPFSGLDELGAGRCRHRRRGARGRSAHARAARAAADPQEHDGRRSERIRRPGARSRATRLCPCGSGKKYKHCHGKND